ncbi:hypothetical protein J4461_01575 [Candidatus Pacearchaeota archaeon]|nr:hypothetical protein [Candidatus Pacearchaeota archaeon]
MLTICQFVDFINLIKTGRAFNGAGNQVPSSRLNEILDEIMTVKSPWRSEWLDAKFEKKGGIIGIGSDMYINYEHSVNQAGDLICGKSEKLESYLDSHKTPGIDAEQWLRDANNYGIPKPTTSNGSLYY